MFFMSSILLLALALHYLGCDAVEVANYEAKEYIRDVSTSIVEVNTHSNRDRVEKACGSDERVLNFRFTTDNYGYETSFEWSNDLVGVFESGPSELENFDDNKTYSYSYCVKIGQRYTLKMKDRMNDGFCCGFGKGTYRYAIDGETLYSSRKKRTFTSVATNTFRVKSRPSTQPNNSLSAASSKSDSTGCITVVVKADKHADELSWIILRNGNQVATSPALKALTPVSKQTCVPKGQYEIVLRDQFGDGLCCGSGDGYFKIFLDGSEIISGTHFQSEKRYKVQVNPQFENLMSARDQEWLVAHNTRRNKYHTQYGASYVPLKWSPQLATEAKRWATELLGDCNTSGIRHEKSVDEGENLAKNKGSGSWGRMYAADKILNRWVENEVGLGYPANAHLTQCLWRATKYVGCGEASKPMNGGSETCRMQVCRYSKAGNCNMNHHKASIGNNWIKLMIETDSSCGPECAPEGCY